MEIEHETSLQHYAIEMSICAGFSKIGAEDSEHDSNQEDEEDNDTGRTQIRKDLSTMSFEDLMKLKEQLGTKVYNEAIFGKNLKSQKKKQLDFKRANKNRPREMGVRRPVPFLCAEERQRNEVTDLRDPRFDGNCGEYNSRIFKQNYEFISDIRTKEVKNLRKKLKKATDEEKKENLKFLILRLENQICEQKKGKIREQALKDEREEIQKARQEGKTPRYKSNRERKTTELVNQYLDLKNAGRLKKHLEKRRKKNAAKDRKKFNFD